VQSLTFEMSALKTLVRRLPDARSRRVVFLSHCLLNENTRYLGGACRPGCVREVVDRWITEGVGIVQMPCPEQCAWGGVLKRRFLALYGRALASRALTPVALLYTRRKYQRLARAVAAQVADYVASGFDVVGLVGVDGSPSCGVSRTIDVRRALVALGAVDPQAITVAQQERLLRRCACAGPGLFIRALAAELERRRLDVPLSAHDLRSEQGDVDSRRRPRRASRARRSCPSQWAERRHHSRPVTRARKACRVAPPCRTPCAGARRPRFDRVARRLLRDRANRRPP
jgi:predicted secreted protein